MHERTLRWDGCANVRDLGGHATEDGRETLFRAVVRADSRGMLTEAGWKALEAYGVSRVVDLRRDDELAEDPPDLVELDVFHVSLMAGIERPEEWELVKRAAAAAPDARTTYAILYAAALEQCRSTIALALTAVAGAPEGAVVVHCTAGKDRTGLVAALLLRLCGVSIADVDADYADSERALRDAGTGWIEAATDGEERTQRLVAAETPAGAIAEVLTRLEHDHRSVDGYLEAAGLGAGDQARLRARLLG